MTDFLRTATVAVEIAHHSVDGILHGHTLAVTATTRTEIDLDRWKAVLEDACRHMERGTLEETVGRTFEDVAQRVLDTLPEACRVTVSLPSRGHAIEAIR